MSRRARSLDLDELTAAFEKLTDADKAELMRWPGIYFPAARLTARRVVQRDGYGIKRGSSR